MQSSSLFNYFTVIFALQVIYIYYSYTVDILYNGWLPIIFSQLCI